jgi:hypothetical protein
MKRLLLPVSLLPLLLVLPALPASAAGGYGPPQRITTCDTYGEVVAVADGGLWGVLGCGGALRVVHRTPAGSWSSRALPHRGHVRAVADDGRTTFFVFSGDYSPSGTALRIAKVPHGGTPSAARTLSESSEETPSATLVARDGRWWAAWDQTSYGGDARSERTAGLWHARSIEPAFGPRPVFAGGNGRLVPHLGLRGTGAVLGFSAHSGADGYGTPQPGLATAGPDGAFTTRELGIATPDGGRVADLTVSGGRTVVALHHGTRTLLALDDGALRFTSRQVLTRAAPLGVNVAASTGRVFLGYTACFTSAAGHHTCRAYVAEGAATGALATTEVSAPFGRTDPAVQVWWTVVTAARGRATAVTEVGGGRGTWSQTQQAT